MCLAMLKVSEDGQSGLFSEGFCAGYLCHWRSTALYPVLTVRCI